MPDTAILYWIPSDAYQQSGSPALESVGVARWLRQYRKVSTFNRELQYGSKWHSTQYYTQEPLLRGGYKSADVVYSYIQTEG